MPAPLVQPAPPAALTSRGAGGRLAAGRCGTDLPWCRSAGRPQQTRRPRSELCAAASPYIGAGPRASCLWTAGGGPAPRRPRDRLRRGLRHDGQRRRHVTRPVGCGRARAAGEVLGQGARGTRGGRVPPLGPALRPPRPRWPRKRSAVRREGRSRGSGWQRRWPGRVLPPVRPP